MKPTLTLKIIANNCPWPSWPEKIAELQAWFSPRFNLKVDFATTSFTDIPFDGYVSTTGQPGLQGVDRDWYDDNITHLAPGYDMVMFVMDLREWKAAGARGWRTDRDSGPIELQAGVDEREFMQWPNFTSMNAFYQIARHEICHALYMISGQIDNTHKYWDMGRLEYVLNEIDLSEKVMIKQVWWNIGFLQKLLAKFTLQKQPLKLVDAMIKVESGGDDWAVGDKHLIDKAYGCLQIRKPCVDDVNRVYKTTYTAQGMLGNRRASLDVFDKYLAIYATEKRLGRPVTDQDRARIWNGGPTGWKRSTTEGYWTKVNKHLNPTA